MFKHKSNLAVPAPERLDISGLHSSVFKSKSGGKSNLSTISQCNPPLPLRTKPRPTQAWEGLPVATAVLPGPSRQFRSLAPVVLPGRSCQLHPVATAGQPGSSRQLFSAATAVSPDPSRKLHSVATDILQGPIRQLYPSATHVPDESVLDGIAALSPPFSEHKRVLRGTAKKTTKLASTSSSKIPSLARSGRPVLSLSRNKPIPNRNSGSNGGTLRKMIAKKKEDQSSSFTMNSTAMFEADERAMTTSTPGVNRITSHDDPSSTSCKCCCTVAEELQEMRTLCETLLKDSKDGVFALLSEQKKFISEFSELVRQQKQLFSESTFRKLLRPHSLSVLSEEDDAVMSEEHEKENNKTTNGEDNVASAVAKTGRALQEYNNMRQAFNSLDLRTPLRRTSRRASGLTPKTPKSVISITLQEQLGAIYDT